LAYFLRNAVVLVRPMAIVVFSIYLQWLPAGGFEEHHHVYFGLARTLTSQVISYCRR